MTAELPELLQLFLALAGFAALAAVVIDILKRAGVVTDGTAPTWSLVINLIGFILFVVANILGLDIAGIDAILASVASVLVALLGLFGQVMVSKATHMALRGTALSFSRSSLR